jgi:exodeoxyribonuclease VII large subunit
VAQASSLGDLMRGRVAHLQQRLDFAARELKSPFERLVLNRLALKSAAQSLSTAFAHHVSDAQRQLERAQARFSKPETQQARANWSRAAARLSRAHADGLRARREALARASTALTHLNPQGVLSRGYALARDAQGRIVQDAAALQSGDALTVQFARGAVKTRVEGSAD